MIFFKRSSNVLLLIVRKLIFAYESNLSAFFLLFSTFTEMSLFWPKLTTIAIYDDNTERYSENTCQKLATTCYLKLVVEAYFADFHIRNLSFSSNILYSFFFLTRDNFFCAFKVSNSSLLEHFLTRSTWKENKRLPQKKSLKKFRKSKYKENWNQQVGGDVKKNVRFRVYNSFFILQKLSLSIQRAKPVWKSAK